MAANFLLKFLQNEPPSGTVVLTIVNQIWNFVGFRKPFQLKPCLSLVIVLKISLIISNNIQNIREF